MINIVICGGGFGGLYVLNYLHRYFHKNKSISVTLINEKNYFLFTPLLPEIATGSVSLDNGIEAIREIIKCCDFNFIHNRIVEINLQDKIVKTKDAIINFDYLVIALGSKNNFYNIKGAEEFSYTLKNIDDAIKLKNRFVHIFELASNKYLSNSLADLKRMLTFVIVGGGATGVELAGEMNDLFYKTFIKFYHKDIIDNTQIIIIEKNQEILTQFSQKLRSKARSILTYKNVKILNNVGVIEVKPNAIFLDNGESIPTQTVIWVAGVKANLPLIVGEINYDNRGSLLVNDFLQLPNYNNVFVVGDSCCFINNQKPLPQLAQVATKQAYYVALNIKNLINNKKPIKFFYKHSGDLISIGKFYALGDIKGIIISGFFAWLLWKGVYLSKMISFRDKIKTLVDWTLNLFLPRDISEI